MSTRQIEYWLDKAQTLRRRLQSSGMSMPAIDEYTDAMVMVERLRLVETFAEVERSKQRSNTL